MSETGSRAISVIWPDIEELPVPRANQFLGQVSPGSDGASEDILVSIGYLAPPVFLGTPDEQQATMAALGALNVKSLARFSLARGRLQELISVLQQVASQYDEGSAKEEK